MQNKESSYSSRNAIGNFMCQFLVNCPHIDLILLKIVYYFHSSGWPAPGKSWKYRKVMESPGKS